MLNFNSILLFSENPKKLVEFYKQVFNKDPEWTGGDYSGWKVGSGFITIGPHSKVIGKNINPERLLINFETTDVETEFARIEKIGAKVIAKPYHPGEEEKMTLATFEDPDGNYFQLNTPMK